MHRRRSEHATLNAEEIQKEMLRNRTETKGRKNFRDSLKDAFTKDFATPKRKSRTLTGVISFYLNDGTHSMSTKRRCFTNYNNNL